MYLFKTEKIKNHVDFLDGYRGTLAIWVLLGHCYMYANLDGDFRYFEFTALFIGVSGFFLLSAYLLTYRLLNDLSKNETKSLKKIISTLIKYFIRRFFRIYIPYAIICVLIKRASPIFGGPHDFEKYTLSQLLYLNTTTLSHLWTIPCEIKYYFFIPLLAIISNKINKNALTKLGWLLALIVCLFLIERTRLIVDFDKNGNFTRENHEFLTRFTTFFIGSILGLCVHFINSIEIIAKIKNHSLFRFLFGVVSLVLFLKGLTRFSRYYNTDLRIDMDFFDASLYWSIFLFMFIVGSPNFFTNFFKLGLFKYCGKFSYGIYLYHMMVIDYIHKNYRNTVKLKIEIVIYCFVSIFVIGFIFYYLVEKNLIRLANFICSFF